MYNQSYGAENEDCAILCMLRKLVTIDRPVVSVLCMFVQSSAAQDKRELSFFVLYILKQIFLIVFLFC